jgi:predicted transcriptional regulator of viral defense system
MSKNTSSMKKDVLKKFDNLLYFNKHSLKVISGDSDSTISANINRWKKNDQLIMFKNGIYATRKSYDINSRKSGYHKYISSILLKPSYISLTTTLSEYDILTEGVYNITAVSIKLPTTYSKGKYSYRQIKEELFKGYEIKYFEEYEYYEATKAKALFDYIYYKAHRIDLEGNIMEDLRLNLDSFEKKDFNEMISYAKFVKSKKLLNIIQNLEKQALAKN